jgi:hypothetical protein
VRTYLRVRGKRNHLTRTGRYYGRHHPGDCAGNRNDDQRLDGGISIGIANDNGAASLLPTSISVPKSQLDRSSYTPDNSLGLPAYSKFSVRIHPAFPVALFCELFSADKWSVESAGDRGTTRFVRAGRCGSRNRLLPCASVPNAGSRPSQAERAEQRCPGRLGVVHPTRRNHRSCGTPSGVPHVLTRLLDSRMVSSRIPNALIVLDWRRQVGYGNAILKVETCSLIAP